MSPGHHPAAAHTVCTTEPVALNAIPNNDVLISLLELIGESLPKYSSPEGAGTFQNLMVVEG
jgi:hypothetical protein